MARHHLAGIVGRRAAARRRVNVQLDAALAGRLEVVGVHLDLVGQRGPGHLCGEEQRQADEREPYWDLVGALPSISLSVVPLRRTTRPSLVSSTASPLMKEPSSMSTVWDPPA